jgi:hypothetical protein
MPHHALANVPRGFVKVLFVRMVGFALLPQLGLELRRDRGHPLHVALTTTTPSHRCGRTRLVVVPMVVGCSRR